MYCLIKIIYFKESNRRTMVYRNAKAAAGELLLENKYCQATCHSDNLENLLQK